MIKVLDSEIPFMLMALRRPAVLLAASREDSVEGNLMLLKEWQHPIIESISGRDRRFPVIPLGKPDFAVGIDEGLLVDPSPGVECLLREEAPTTRFPLLNAIPFNLTWS
jgi:hypothetical protein